MYSKREMLVVVLFSLIGLDKIRTFTTSLTAEHVGYFHLLVTVASATNTVIQVSLWLDSPSCNHPLVNLYVG